MHRLFLALATLALALRILVPVGFMIATPASAAHMAGGIPIVLCTGQGKVAAIMAPDGTINKTDPSQKHPKNPDDQMQGDCAFAGVATPTLANFSPLLKARTWSLETDRHAAITGDQVPGRGLAAPPPPATAPPDFI